MFDYKHVKKTDGRMNSIIKSHIIVNRNVQNEAIKNKIERLWRPKTTVFQS